MNEMPQQISESKVCESCGETFGCGANLPGCWCAEVKISAEAAAELKAEFADCLCPKCLGARAAGTGIAVKYPDGKVELIDEAVRVDTQNFHEGMFDFYDQAGNLLRQIDMGSGISWEEIGPSRHHD